MQNLKRLGQQRLCLWVLQLGVIRLESREFLRIIIEQATLPVVIDAGIGAPSQAAEAIEMGADAVLINTAIAVSGDPIAMAGAFRKAVEAGRMAHLAGLGSVQKSSCVLSINQLSFLNLKL